MRQDAKIDFETGLFDEPTCNESHDNPMKRRSIFFPLIFAALLFFIMVAIALAINMTSDDKYYSGAFSDGTQLSEVEILSDHELSSQIQKIKSVEYTEHFCGEDKLFCFTVTTNKPSEILSKLAAVMPDAASARYRVMVSIVPNEG
ncbi:TPA: hypothetical protein I8303_003470 [Aeromonas hydrophila]|uniref:Uncharacterized protein n=1 Tax=Escherichia coli TaxID=562 RepID=A0A3L0VXE7_ECOLX|nr:hypothetical protein [Aeromonas sp.]HAT2714689.1 hypothetical protein [Aeromonas hydrophila]